jgi:hypothetical protein
MSTQDNDPPIGDIEISAEEQEQLEQLDNMLDMEPIEVLDKLNDTSAGEDPKQFQRFHMSLMTDASFSDLYGDGVGSDGEWSRWGDVAFIYKMTLFFRNAIHGGWEMASGEELVEWLLDNPPGGLDDIAALYSHSKGVEHGSPWMLFQYITGIAETTQSWQITKLIPIGVNDAYHLGEALTEWFRHDRDAHTYVELLLEYTELATGS